MVCDKEFAAPVAAQESDATSGMAVDLSVYTDLGAIEQTWRSLESRAVFTPFQSFGWLAAWQRNVGGTLGAVPAIVVGRAGGQAMFIMPFSVLPFGPWHRLAWLADDFSDYNGPLLDRTFLAGLVPEQFLLIW